MKRWIAVGVALFTTACASVGPVSPVAGPERRAAVPGFSFATDTFEFRNDIRARTPYSDELYANYCFVLARGLRQFFAYARFDARAPRLTSEEYLQRVRELARHSPWDPVPPPDDRIVIPGYADLREFSRGQEAAVKEGLGGRFWTMVNWTNWRVTFPVSRAHQAGVAREIMDELDAGRLVQLLVTNWPKPELNHGVVTYAYRTTPEGVEFSLWDPNDPATPGVMTFDTAQGTFQATRIYDTEQGPIRAFRMYYSWWL